MASKGLQDLKQQVEGAAQDAGEKLRPLQGHPAGRSGAEAEGLRNPKVGSRLELGGSPPSLEMQGLGRTLTPPTPKIILG